MAEMKKNPTSTNTSAKTSRVAEVPTATPPHGSKSAFVRNMPPHMPAKDVVAKGKAVGLTFSIGQVYNIRNVAKAQQQRRKALAASLKTAPKAPHPKASSASAASIPDVDGRLRKLIAEVGLARARQVIVEVMAAFGV